MRFRARYAARRAAEGHAPVNPLRKVAIGIRLWPKVNKFGPVSTHRPDLGPCWVWTGALCNGYGVIRSGGKTLGAHRVVYEMLMRPIPDGLQIDHLCRVPACVNPSHLEPVTCQENVLRGISPSAAAAVKAACVNGHPFDDANTLRSTDGRKRICRACARDRMRRKSMARRDAILLMDEQ